MSHEFLHALERTGCLRVDYGWQAHHLALYDGDALVAAAPVYLKGNSHGEFVFDWSWASAWERAGGDYYPKLLNAVPYSPVSGPRLLAGNGNGAGPAARAERRHAGRSGSPGAVLGSCQFLPATDRAAFDDQWLSRSDIQFHWHNRDYRHFPDFLATLSHKKRKNILRERAQVAASGLDVQWRAGSSLSSAEWAQIHALYETTFDAKGNHAALTQAFFEAMADMGKPHR